MDRPLPPAERENANGACWACLKQRRTCDAAMPRCQNCIKLGLKCPGYGVQLSLLDGPLGPNHRPSRRQARQSPKSRASPPKASSPGGTMPGSLSALGLPTEQSFYMQHFSHNISRIALAIDYEGNGYRSLLPMAMSEPALLNAMLAVAASHYSRWKQTADKTSQAYLRASCRALKLRFADPALINSSVTLATMLLLATHEVFSGTSRWEAHYDAIRGWIRERGDCSDLDAFLKNWVCLIDTQGALNLGTSTMAELDSWMDAAADQQGVVDALFGCSAKLPKLMSAASRLYVASKDPQVTWEDILSQAEALQQQIRGTKMTSHALPMLGLSCNSAVQAFSVTVGLDEDEMRRRAVATAEIFRHAAHIFVYRITHGPEEALTPEMQESLECSLQLLPLVPDALGPGANLGWCLVVLGAELDMEDQREYIASRWEGLHLLGVCNTRNAQRILDEAWSHRDLARQGSAVPERLQDTMQRIGQTQILV